MKGKRKRPFGRAWWDYDGKGNKMFLGIEVERPPSGGHFLLHFDVPKKISPATKIGKQRIPAGPDWSVYNEIADVIVKAINEWQGYKE